jgi:hypothetical protein
MSVYVKTPQFASRSSKSIRAVAENWVENIEHSLDLGEVQLLDDAFFGRLPVSVQDRLPVSVQDRLHKVLERGLVFYVVDEA